MFVTNSQLLKILKNFKKLFYKNNTVKLPIQKNKEKPNNSTELQSSRALSISCLSETKKWKLFPNLIQWL